MDKLFSSLKYLEKKNDSIRVIRYNHQNFSLLHHHEFTELVVVYNGTGHHVIHGESLPIKAGDVFIVLPGVTHQYIQADDLKLFNILFDLNCLDNPLTEFSSYPEFHALFLLDPQNINRNGLHLPPEQLIEVMSLVESMEYEGRQKYYGYRMFVLGTFISLISKLGRFYFNYAKNPEFQPLLQLSYAINELNKDCSKDWNRKEIANLAKVSVRSLTRLFKRYTSHSPTEYLIYLRMKKAMHMLRMSDQSIGEIAFAVGFHDNSYFSRQFRRITTMTPRQYRIKARICPDNANNWPIC